jgi:glycosyltransferase involved in cell wall biosynthesis
VRCKRESANLRVLQEAIGSFRPDVVSIWGLWNLSRALPSCAEQCVSPGRVAYYIADYWPMEPDMDEYYWELPARRPVVERAKAAIRPGILRRLAAERARHPIELRNVACVSEYVLAKLQRAGVLPRGGRVIRNGIDPGPFLAHARQSQDLHVCRLLYFGALGERKGVHTAIEALGLLQQRGEAEGYSLTIVGSGHPDYVARLHNLVEELGLAARVSFVGQVPRAVIPGMLGMFDVFLFTSIYEEPIARTVMEAMAAGLAVIGTTAGGQREILSDGKNALVVPPSDAVAFADRIHELRGSPELFERLVEAGRETVLTRYTLERMVDEIEAWLQLIVDGAEAA